MAKGRSEWEHRVIDRSLLRSAESIRTRGIGPATRIVNAAIAISMETDGSSFSVQQVADRADVALQTFYRHFGSKDALLLALLEEFLKTNVEALKEQALLSNDPIEQLRIIITNAFETPGETRGYGLAVVREHFRLLEQFPIEVEQASAHYTDLLIFAMNNARNAGKLSSPDIPADAVLITNLVLYNYHRMRLGAIKGDPSEIGRRVWDLCRRALGVVFEVPGALTIVTNQL